jgi:hypothetical protein
MLPLQRDIEPYDQVILERIALDKEWKKYHLSGKANRDYAANVTELNYNLALAKQTIEFAEFYVMNIGPDGDPGTIYTMITMPIAGLRY